MQGKIILNLAISLDGFIADKYGGFEWISGQGDSRLDTDNEHNFDLFKESIDVVVMGSKSYHQGEQSYVNDYKDKKVYVATHDTRENKENITFISGDIVGHVRQERDAGKMIYLFGGGIAIAPFIKADIIDEYMIAVIPVILGNGRPLFMENNPTIALLLKDYSVRDGICQLHYVRR